MDHGPLREGHLVKGHMDKPVSIASMKDHFPVCRRSVLQRVYTAVMSQFSKVHSLYSLLFLDRDC